MKNRLKLIPNSVLFYSKTIHSQISELIGKDFLFILVRDTFPKVFCFLFWIIVYHSIVIITKDNLSQERMNTWSPVVIRNESKIKLSIYLHIFVADW